MQNMEKLTQTLSIHTKQNKTVYIPQLIAFSFVKWYGKLINGNIFFFFLK
jgi:hypothetical protein